VPHPSRMALPVPTSDRRWDRPRSLIAATVPEADREFQWTFPSVRSIPLARWSTGPRAGLTDDLSAPWLRDDVCWFDLAHIDSAATTRYPCAGHALSRSATRHQSTRSHGPRL
jgi:hypothetical protein